MFYKRDLLITGGCSFTARYVDVINKNYDLGNKILNFFDHQTQKVIDFEWRKIKPFDVWPEIIADRLNLKLHNTAKCGDGNEAIFNNVYDAIINNPKNVYAVMIFWTDWSRRDVERYESKLDKIEMLNTRFNKEENLRTDIKKNILASYIKADALHYKIDIEIFLRNCLNIDQICKHHNIPIIHAQALYPLSSIDLNTSYQATYLRNAENDKYDLKNYDGWKKFDSWAKRKQNRVNAMNYFLNHKKFSILDKQKNFIDWPIFTEIGGTHFGNIIHDKKSIYRLHEQDAHPSKLGHEYIADMFMNHFNKI